VVSESQYHDLFLAQESISLFNSLELQAMKQGIAYYPTAAIFSMQEKMLEDASALFLNDIKAVRTLQEYSDDIDIDQVLKSGFNVLVEPMWSSLLHAIYQMKIMQLRKKARIFVENGCVLMGVPDESRCLKRNEVFLQIQVDNTSEPVIILGDVVVYRHPCLYPGDMVIVTAVNCPKLSSRINVLVFATDTSGIAVPSRCSGGDLDGDHYYIIYDKDLVPPKSLQFDSLNYDKLAEEAKQLSTTSVQTNEEYFVRIIKNSDILGEICSMHVAYSDDSPLGTHDPLSIELAKAASLAVDSPKTGVVPAIPDCIKKLVRCVAYYLYCFFIKFKF
jgi:RNA-dependent RNA polymerase